MRLDAAERARVAGVLAAAPALLLRKLRKVMRNPHAHRNELDPARWSCRPVGLSRRARPVTGEASPHVVFVGKGYGEMRLIERLDEGLLARVPRARTTWCGQIDEFFEGVDEVRPRQPRVRLPFDVAPAVSRWLGQVVPDVVVLVEQFWRPVLAVGCASAGVAVVAANAVAWKSPPTGAILGRLEAWQRRRVCAAISRFCFQSEEQADKARPFLADDQSALVTGNVKLDLRPAASSPERASALQAWLAPLRGRPLFVAGSTRRGDEAFVLEAFREVRRRRTCALLLAPRQLERMEEVVSLLDDAGLVTSRFTSPRSAADVYLLDTIGALASAYVHGAAAFVGGTLRHRGQNFVEPLLHGLPVSFGPADVLLAQEQRACEEAGLGVRVRTPHDLAQHWLDVLEPSQTAARSPRTELVEGFLARHRGALDRTLDVLLPLLGGVPA